MSRRSKRTNEERITIVQEYLDGKENYEIISTKNVITLETFRKMVIFLEISEIE